MQRAATSRLPRWTHALLSAALLATILFACNTAPLAPRAGLLEFMEYSRVPVPGGHVNAAGGNYFHELTALELDTRLGPFSIGAVYNSAGGWTWNVDASYQDGTLRDAAGTSLPLAALAAGDAVPGSHWVKLDATRVKTKGGLVHEFDAGTGRLLAVYWSSSAYPRLRFAQTQIAALWRTSAVEQCTSATACVPVFTLGYDAAARLVRVDDRAGRAALFGYDDGGKLSFARDGLDVAKDWPGERYTYGGDLLTSITSSEGERIEIAGDALGRTTEVRGVGAGDPIWRFSHGLPNAAGVYTISATDPLGSVTSYDVDGASRMLSVTNALGERTELAWSGLRPAARTLPDGTRTTWTWSNDDVASETEPSGNVRTYTYQTDGVNRERPLARPLLELRDALGLVERRSYDENGRLVGVTNGASETTLFAYEANQALARVTAPSGSALRLAAYGEHGWPSFALYAGSDESAASSYDAVGNRVQGTVPDPLSGGVVRRVYDADRNLATLEVIDAPASGTPVLRAVVLEHRSDGQLSRVRRPGGGETTFSYDALGRLVAIREQTSPGATPQPGAASVTTIARDLLGRVVAVERANGMREETVYDAAGRIVRRRALRAGAVESDVALERVAGRLVRAVGAGGFQESLVYDAAGRVREVAHTQGESTRFSYDVRSRLTQTELTLAGGAPLATFAHGYDLAGRETSLSYLGVDLITHSFSAGRIEHTQYGNGVRLDHFRSTQTGRTRGRELWRGGRRIEKSDYTIDAAPGGAITQLRSVVADGTSADAVVQEDFSYAALSGRNSMARRVASSLATTSGAAAERIHYDALSNFIGGLARGMAAAVAYNAEGNRVLAATHLSPLPYEPGATSAFTHDAAGFASSETIWRGGSAPTTNSFAWNARGQIAAIHSNGALVASFAYDALGRRLERSVGATTKRWRFGGLVEANAAGQPIAIDLGEVRVDLAGNHLFRHADLRGNPQHVTNAAGRVVRNNVYSAYGPTGVFGSQSDDASFAGGTGISAGGVAYVVLGARLYAPMLARFLAPDPIWNPLNTFAYTLGNPVDFSDPSGLHAGSHHDLTQARFGVARSMLGYAAALLLFVSAPVGLPTAAAAIGLAIAVGGVVDALIELDQQSRRHLDQTLGAGSTPENSRGGGAVSGGGGGTGFGGGRGVGVVCSSDGQATVCTRTPLRGTGAGRIFYPHIVLE